MFPPSRVAFPIVRFKEWNFVGIISLNRSRVVAGSDFVVILTVVPTRPPLPGRVLRRVPAGFYGPAVRAPQTASRPSGQTVSIGPSSFYLGKARIGLRGKIAYRGGSLFPLAVWR